MLKRQMVWELRKKHLGESDEADDWGAYDDPGDAADEQPPVTEPSEEFTAKKKTMGAALDNILVGRRSGPEMGGDGGFGGGPVFTGGAANGGGAPDAQETDDAWDTDGSKKDQQWEVYQPEAAPSKAGSGDAGAGFAYTDDPTKRPQPAGWVDQEVGNPNLMRAAPAGEDPMLNASSEGGGRNPRFVYPDSTLEGWVWKRSRFLKRWRRRYLVLTANNVAAYRMRGDPVATECITRGEYQSCRNADHDVQQSRSFGIITLSRNYFMVCDDVQQRDEWANAISNIFGATGRR